MPQYYAKSTSIITLTFMSQHSKSYHLVGDVAVNTSAFLLVCCNTSKNHSWSCNKNWCTKSGHTLHNRKL